MSFVAVKLNVRVALPVFFENNPYLTPGTWVIYSFENKTNDAPVTCACVVDVTNADGLTKTELPFHLYREVLASDPGASVAACQYSVAPRRVLFHHRLSFSGCRANVVEPHEPKAAVELTMPPPDAPAQQAMRMWYPVVLASGFKVPLVHGCAETGLSILCPQLLDAWLQLSGTTNLPDLARPLSEFADYRKEIRNQYQNLLLAAACTGRRVTGDCEDFALAVFGVMLSLQRHRRRAFGIEWTSAQPCIVAGHLHRPGGIVEPHMWAGVQEPGSPVVRFIETIGTMLPGARYVGVRIIYKDGAAFMQDNRPLDRETPAIPPGPLNYRVKKLPIVEIPPFKLQLPGRLRQQHRDWAATPPAQQLVRARADRNA